MPRVHQQPGCHLPIFKVLHDSQSRDLELTLHMPSQFEQVHSGAAGTKCTESATFPESRRCHSHLLLNNRDARLVVSKHVVGESSTLDTCCIQALGGQLKALEGVAHKPACQQEEQRVVDDQ